MPNAESVLNVSVMWRGNKYIVEMNSNSLLKDLGDELQKLTDVKADTMRLIVPQFPNKSSKLLYPFSNDQSCLSLQEASITEGKFIQMMGVSEDEVDKVLRDAKVDLRIAGFDEEEKRMRQRMSYRTRALLQLPQGPYIFCNFRTLELPGVELNPPASEALKRMHMLAADPGIVAIMNKHRWRVGIMTEMAPVGYVGVSPKCILGFNKNHGQEISLRLRTDDLKGFRKYESIKKTLLHELAHMVYSEHDANFYALDKQLNQEAANLDWTKSRGHTVSGSGHPYHHEETIDVADNEIFSQKLGGNISDQLASARASSVAAAYRRLADISANNSGVPEVHEEPDPDDSEFNLDDEPDNINYICKDNINVGCPPRAQRKSDHEPDPDEQSCDQNKYEPDPDDSQTNHFQVMQILNRGSKIIDEPDPDDLEVRQNDLNERDIKRTVQSTFPVTETESKDNLTCLNMADKGSDPDEQYCDQNKDEPDPDDSQGNHFQVMQILNRGSKTIDEPDPDDLEVRQNNLKERDINRTVQSTFLLTETESKDNLAHLNKADRGSDPDEFQANRLVQPEPHCDDLVPSSDMQIDEPDPDDQELRRIQDPVAVFCTRLQKAIETLRSDLDPMDATAALQTLFKIIRNVMEHPDEMKFKRLRLANPIIERNVANHKAAMEILHMVGFTEDAIFDEIGREETFLVLKRNDPGLLWLAKSSLE